MELEGIFMSYWGRQVVINEEVLKVPKYKICFKKDNPDILSQTYWVPEIVASLPTSNWTVATLSQK